MPYNDMNSDFQDTIAALASPTGEGGVAVIRMSGHLAPYIFEKMFSSSQISTQNTQSHHLYYGSLKNPEGQLLDHVLAVWMKAPHSFTGEEVIEFHTHGGRLIVWNVLQTIYTWGARPAGPGEFTQRAFLNGKIDLTQAESIADMIAAQSELSLKLAQAQWSGAISKPVSELRKKLLEVLVYLEAAIDFPDEDIEIIELSKMKVFLEEALLQLQSWVEDYELGRIFREGLTVVLAGKPNVGKSSLLNALSKEDAAIVHEQPGTTRDAIERRINLGGLAIRLVDTAGIRDATELVEKVGIDRSKVWFEKADLLLALFDTSCPLVNDDFDLVKIASKRKSLILLTKSDLPSQWKLSDLLGETQLPFLSLSTLKAFGLDELQVMIPQLFALEEFEKGNHLMISQLRHREALQKSIGSIKAAIELIDEKLSPELIAVNVMEAAHHIGEIIGEVNSEHVLDDIFSRFCIGK